MLWLGNTPMPPQNGAGRMSFLPGISPLTPVLAHPSPSCCPQRHQQSHQGCSSPCRSDEAHQSTHLSSFLRHPPAATRYRHPHHAATARAQRCGHHYDLYPHPAAGWPGRSKSLGRSRRLICILSCLPNAKSISKRIRQKSHIVKHNLRHAACIFCHLGPSAYTTGRKVSVRIVNSV